MDSSILSTFNSRFIGLKINALGKGCGQAALKLLSTLESGETRASSIKGNQRKPHRALCYSPLATNSTRARVGWCF
jgi:hypothetical protein